MTDIPCLPGYNLWMPRNRVGNLEELRAAIAELKDRAADIDRRVAELRSAIARRTRGRSGSRKPAKRAAG